MTELALERTPFTIAAAGANNGGRGAIPYLVALNQDSLRRPIKVINVDPVPGRADALATRAARAGVQAISREEEIATTIPTLPDGATIVLHVDNPKAVADALTLAAERPIAALGYGFLKSADGTLFGFRFQYGADDMQGKLAGARFFRGIATFTGRGGRERIFGERGAPQHVEVEPLFRSWFGRHLDENIRKFTAGLPSNHSNLEITTDGTRTMPVFVHENPGEWSEPYTLTQEVLDNPPEPVLKGDQFCIAEVHRDGVRLHFARLRRSDGRVSVNGYAGFDPQTLASMEAAERTRIEAAESERLQRDMTRALQRAERKTVTRRAPFFMTD